MRQVTSGGEGQIADLVQKYRTMIYRFFRKRVGTDDLAEDMTQELFANLMSRAKLQDIENVESYIFTTASNLLKDRHRYERRRPLVLGNEYDDAAIGLVDEIDPERILANKQIYQNVMRALQALPERQRHIFILSRFENLTGKEIAGQLSLSTRQVEKDMSKAIKFLRGQIS